MGLTSDSVGLHACKAMLPDRRPGDLVVALLGNPNTGKSTVFNALTGKNQHTGNWAGKTVTSACGIAMHGGRRFILVDLPGTYSLSAKSPEEEVARDFLASGQADCTIVVADATCLERNLNLVLQAAQLCPRTAVCLNLMDEARRRGFRIDFSKLQQMLGLPVVPCAAREGAGLSELLSTVLTILQHPPQPVPVPLPASARDPSLPPQRRAEIQTAATILRAEEIACTVVRSKETAAANRDRKIDRLLTSRAAGIPVMLALLAGVLFLTILGANYPSAALSRLFSALTPFFSSGLAALHAPVWLHSLLLDGVWEVLSTVVSVMLPPMAIFFPLFTLLEDAGYLPRVAFNLDHAFCRVHACGKQALTMRKRPDRVQNLSHCHAGKSPRKTDRPFRIESSWR